MTLEPQNSAHSEPVGYCLPLDANPGLENQTCDSPYRAPADVLRRNAMWFCRLRWAVVAMLAAAGILAVFQEPFAHWGLRMSPGWPLVTAAVLAVFNLGYLMLLPRRADNTNAAAVRANLWVQIVVDLLALTAVVHFLGSLETYAMFMYLFHIILACIFFPRPQALAVAMSAVALYFACLAMEVAGWLTPQTVLAHAGVLDRAQLSTQGWVLQIGSAVFVWAGIWYLASRQAGELRKRERDLAVANQRLQAGIEERSRHMLQTTHQLKAPFAAVHANAQLLLGGYCGALPDAAISTVGKISSRCAVLSQQILEMLQLANLRSAAQVRPRATVISLDQLVAAVISRVAPTAASRSIQIKAALQPVSVAADDDHLRMIVENLLTNAINYSFDGGIVEVHTDGSLQGAPRLLVRDSGIGIPPDKLPRIFDDYFRTNEAAIHNKASTGLGLAIVRDAARMWNIRVDVKSAPGRGTEFTLTFPAGQPDSARAEP